MLFRSLSSIGLIFYKLSHSQIKVAVSKIGRKINTQRKIDKPMKCEKLDNGKYPKKAEKKLHPSYKELTRKLFERIILAKIPN